MFNFESALMVTIEAMLEARATRRAITRTERRAEAARERACRGVRGATPLGVE
jgi:hypothetical protein